MPILYCPRCSKSLSDAGVFGKNVTTQSSGPFIAGHILGNANLPLIGVPLNSSTSHYGLFCKVCGEEVNKIPTSEESAVIEAKLKDHAKKADEFSHRLQVV